MLFQTLGVACIIALGQYDFIFGLTIHHVQNQHIFERLYDSLRQTHLIRSPITFLFFLANFVPSYFLIRAYPRVPWAIIFTVFGGIVGYLGTVYRMWPEDQLVTFGEHFEGTNLNLILFSFPVLSRKLTIYPRHFLCPISTS